MMAWVDHLNSTVLAEHSTRLTGGFDEPFYRAPSNCSLAEIQFTHDFERSALHELAHWCVAGKQRRQRDDYGYWYEPDGRSNEQQQLFFKVEVLPQAIERHFCNALGIPFDVSVDNLGNTGVDGVCAFRNDVERQYQVYACNGLPERAAAICQQFKIWRLKS